MRSIVVNLWLGVAKRVLLVLAWDVQKWTIVVIFGLLVARNVILQAMFIGMAKIGIYLQCLVGVGQRSRAVVKFWLGIVKNILRRCLAWDDPKCGTVVKLWLGIAKNASAADTCRFWDARKCHQLGVFVNFETVACECLSACLLAESECWLTAWT